MKVFIVCAGTLGEAFAMFSKACNDMCERIKEFNDLVKEACMYEEELQYKECISFPFNPVKVMKSQVIDRKPKCIRARTVC
ncbi:hypothetical protein BK720_25460 [Bacillus thuringiensis serovar brasilensis]|uniref:hypothetical protein n=1 Tax=Bacillus cereus group TaxID=86661 RepID=UPI000A3D551C|nr:hypothetical protein [Bacillus thuringiensis]MCU5032133.1 hypothetical protein [Bacillus cereus]MRA70028.1 hypothetical protein [Bacillus thuringiensis]MRA88510.1 hypothetical protein [Bacillus thuringiensis]MRC51768.1 hypothetical protein [Bacillus thuringiensis]OTX26883.1 hypothetical protein BK720_25460 [Bacillus thuringiensis serovar brasilensis]